MDKDNEIISPELPSGETKKIKSGTPGLFSALVCLMQLGLCAPAVAACACPSGFLAVTLELIGAALVAAGARLLLGERLGQKRSAVLTAGIYALFALLFVWIHTPGASVPGPAVSALIAAALAALCAFALDAANERIDLYAAGAQWKTLPARAAAAVIPALALLAVSAKL